MGNAALTCVSGNPAFACLSGKFNAAFACVSGGEHKVRVLLPDGNIVAFDGPVDVAELMIDHPNHMIVHCSSGDRDPGAIKKRPSVTIMQPGQELQPGEAYLVHPIPPQYKKALSKSQPLQVANFKRKMAMLSCKNYGQQMPRRQRCPRLSSVLLPKFVTYLAALVLGSRFEGILQRSLSLRSDSGSEGLSDDTQAEQYVDEEDEEVESIETNVQVTVYMGWRPALESIPESPHGYQEMPEPPMPLTYL